MQSVEIVYLANLSCEQLRALLKTTRPDDPLHVQAKQECLRRANRYGMVASFAGIGIIGCLFVVMLFAVFAS